VVALCGELDWLKNATNSLGLFLTPDRCRAAATGLADGAAKLPQQGSLSRDFDASVHRFLRQLRDLFVVHRLKILAGVENDYISKYRTGCIAREKTLNKVPPEATALRHAATAIRWADDCAAANRHKGPFRNDAIGGYLLVNDELYVNTHIILVLVTCWGTPRYRHANPDRANIC
jgi:hypothetical protein